MVTRKAKDDSDVKPDMLREQVYSFLQSEMGNGALRCGGVLDQAAICSKLGVSKAPLRDALIRLEAEGFITIFPRRGVLINPLTLDFIKSAYQIIGALEADCMNSVFDLLTHEHIEAFEHSNALQKEYLLNEEYKKYYNENIAFHNIFLSLTKNILLTKTLDPLRRRLYDFPQRKYSVQWEMNHLNDHHRIIDSIRKRNRVAAVSIIRVEHWGFENHKEYLKQYYKDWDVSPAGRHRKIEKGGPVATDVS